MTFQASFELSDSEPRVPRCRVNRVNNTAGIFFPAVCQPLHGFRHFRTGAVGKDLLSLESKLGSQAIYGISERYAFLNDSLIRIISYYSWTVVWYHWGDLCPHFRVSLIQMTLQTSWGHSTTPEWRCVLLLSLSRETLCSWPRAHLGLDFFSCPRPPQT